MSFGARIIFSIICGLLLASGCATPISTGRPASALSNGGTASANPGERFWVYDSGWHTGLVLSRAEMKPALSVLLQRAPDAKFFVFGWGNRRYYMADNPSVFMGIAALFPSQSAVLVQACQSPPTACLPEGARLRIVAVSDGGMAKLDDYLVHAFRMDARGQPEHLGPGPFSHSEFFVSGLSYDVFHTCNTWTAEALHVSGLPVSYNGVIFADQLWRQVR